MRIAVIDSGFTNHPEILKGGGEQEFVDGIQFEQSQNFNEKELGTPPMDPVNPKEPLSDFVGIKVPIPTGHGTSTVSHIISPPGFSPLSKGRVKRIIINDEPGKGAFPLGEREIDITGVAFGAKVYMYRLRSLPFVSSSDLAPLAKAIRHAVDVNKVDVISISMGGVALDFLPNGLNLRKPVEEAIEHAKAQGVIIAGAGGQSIPTENAVAKRVLTSVYPGENPYVVAATTTLTDGSFWAAAHSGGKQNTIAVPSANIWYAGAVPGKTPQDPPEMVYGRGVGTSFAAPSLAGVAALWLQANGGREAIINKHGWGSSKHLVRDAFVSAVVCSAMRPDVKGKSWEKSQSSVAGILNALGVVQQPLNPTLKESCLPIGLKGKFKL